MHTLHSNDGNGKEKAYGNGYFHRTMNNIAHDIENVRKVFLFIKSSSEALNGFIIVMDMNVKKTSENKIDISIFTLNC